MVQQGARPESVVVRTNESLPFSSYRNTATLLIGVRSTYRIGRVGWVRIPSGRWPAEEPANAEFGTAVGGFWCNRPSSSRRRDWTSPPRKSAPNTNGPTEAMSAWEGELP